MAIIHPRFPAIAQVGEHTIVQPCAGSRLLEDSNGTLLFGQPPEVLKGLLQHGTSRFDTLVLPDIREKGGAQTNSLEFPLYFFLFVSKGYAEGRRLNLVGEEADISQALRLLRFTLLGPTRDELTEWRTESGLKDEWLAVAIELALKDKQGKVIPVEDFFNAIPFVNGSAWVGDQQIKHIDTDVFEVSSTATTSRIDLNDDITIAPPYSVQPDYVPGGLVKLGIEVLGGASGFTPDEPCTGLALCYNGEYLLIDCIPYLDHHLFARGISKNQIGAIFLTHLHDDHAALVPLLLMPKRVEIITTVEIFNMAVEKIALSIGWTTDAVAEHLRLVEVTPGETLNYYGLTIDTHVTVHSIPTIGATFSAVHKGIERDLCIVGDNHSMTTVREMTKRGIVRQSTTSNLERLYADRFSLLVADGGAGAIHGDPADAMESNADRVIFVHVDELDTQFNTSFSLATSGKRYTVLEGDNSIYTSQINHYLTEWLGRPFPNRWMRSLLAEEEIRRYNADDVIIVQNASTQGFVYLILTGYCEVVRHDGEQLHRQAKLQAGDVVGEMAVITGSGTRNASVIAQTPVTLCVFAEETFRSFIRSEGFQDQLLSRWAMRPLIAAQPQFADLNSTVSDKLCQIGELKKVAPGESFKLTSDNWCLLASGEASLDGAGMHNEYDYGWRPLARDLAGTITSDTGCDLILFDRKLFERLRLESPLLNFQLRKLRIAQQEPDINWLLGKVSIN